MKSRKNNNHATSQARRIVGFLLNLHHIAPAMTAAMATSQIISAIASTAIAPIFVAKLLAEIASGSASLHNSYGLLVGYAISLIVGEIITVRISLALAYYAESRMQQHVAEQVMASQISKSLDFHANHMSGGIVSDATKLNNSIERFWDTIMFTALPIATTITSVCIALAFFVWQYAIILFVFSVCLVIIIVKFQNSIAPISRAVSEKLSSSTARLADVIMNISAVKAFAGATSEKKAYHQKLDEWRRLNLREMRAVLTITGSFATLMTLLNAGAFFVAIIITQHHIAGISSTYLVIGYTLNIVSQLWQVSSVTRNYTRIIGNAGPMIAMLDAAPELNDPADPEQPKISRGNIRYKEVTFRHKGNKAPIFSDFNLTIKPGEKVGLVGHSGSGKTTFSRLLLRFSDIQSGEILIDGQNIAAITQDDLRQHIAYVPQEPLLFHRSITDNIRYGRPEADMSAIKTAAKLANAHDFIESLPEGYDTLVGEHGVKLSGGQRQRVAIARALLKNSPILVLDEATSALDSESEVLIQGALWNLMKNRTAIVIAHRLSTIQKMDRILVLTKGKIVEEGSHRQLLQLGGTYARLWQHQSGSFIEE